MKSRLQSFEVTYFVHETEDAGRIDRAVANMFQLREPMETERLEGHFGNSILSAKIRTTGEGADRAFRVIASRAPHLVGQRLEDQPGASIDEHSSLFLRFDKQGIVSGKWEPGDRDPVRVKVKPRGFMIRGDPREFYGSFLRVR